MTTPAKSRAYLFLTRVQFQLPSSCSVSGKPAHFQVCCRPAVVAFNAPAESSFTFIHSRAGIGFVTGNILLWHPEFVKFIKPIYENIY